MQKSALANRRGTSLLEVLVAIAIIVILAGIALSTFRSASIKAKDVVCISNIRQLQAAILLYEESHGGPPMNNWRSLRDGGVLQTELKCPVADGRDLNGDYKIYTFYPDGLSIAKQKNDCMRARGGDAVLVLDFNHVSPAFSTKTRTEYLLVGRRNGKIEKVPYEKASRASKDGPCPGGDLTDNI